MAEPVLYRPNDMGQMANHSRLVVVWVAFVNDAVFSLCSYWSKSLAIEDMGCPLPTAVRRSSFRRILLPC